MSCCRMVAGRWVFQQDNDPKHASRLVKDWIGQRRVAREPRPVLADPEDHSVEVAGSLAMSASSL